MFYNWFFVIELIANLINLEITLIFSMAKVFRDWDDRAASLYNLQEYPILASTNPNIT